SHGQREQSSRCCNAASSAQTSLSPSWGILLLKLGGKITGAGDGNRTHVASLEGWSSTIELHPPTSPAHRAASGRWWRGKDSNLRRRTSADLQSAAFDRSATPPAPVPPGAAGVRVLRFPACKVNEAPLGISDLGRRRRGARNCPDIGRK